MPLDVAIVALVFAFLFGAVSALLVMAEVELRDVQRRQAERTRREAAL